MSETTDKINKLAIQHKVIRVKTDYPYFSTIGNLCSRVQNGMMRCDEYLECEFKYIDALKEENENLKQQLEIDKKQINYFIEENEKLKKILQELEDLSLKTYDVVDFQMYFDNLRGKNDGLMPIKKESEEAHE